MRGWAVSLLLGGIALVQSGCVYISGGINPFGDERQKFQETVVAGEGRDKILLLDVTDVITGQEEESGAFGFGSEESTVARVEEALRRAAGDDRVRGVVLRIDSPGGGVTASDAIYREILRFREETGRPVVAELMDVATSGAYYIALAADRIMANPTTVTGSIGVILMGLNVEGLMGKLGIQDQTVKSGAHKDLLSPFRKPTAKDREIVQGVIDELHGRFVSLVRERRPQVPAADLAELTDGRIFTASQAQAVGLIDDIGYVDEAIGKVQSASGIKEARVIMYHRAGEYRENIYSRSGPAPAAKRRTWDELGVSLALPHRRGARFMYLWLPDLRVGR
jgi:protease-4